MRLSKGNIESAVGIRVEFQSAPVTRFHVATSLPNPYDEYRVCAVITLPQDTPEQWIEGVHQVFKRIQNGKCYNVLLDYDNASQYFTNLQIRELEKPGSLFSLCLYGAPHDMVETDRHESYHHYTQKEYLQMYYRAKKATRESAIQQESNPTSR
ncbi:MAG TPA: hypothetical protein IAC31_02200 [Candidatus Faecousia intestinigallinarum]|nr:hypothetical protein [Candidatus Faecousia intestinigallinarum]